MGWARSQGPSPAVTRHRKSQQYSRKQQRGDRNPTHGTPLSTQRPCLKPMVQGSPPPLCTQGASFLQAKALSAQGHALHQELASTWKLGFPNFKGRSVWEP